MFEPKSAIAGCSWGESKRTFRYLSANSVVP